jgi:hypothetical protein
MTFQDQQKNFRTHEPLLRSLNTTINRSCEVWQETKKYALLLFPSSLMHSTSQQCTPSSDPLCWLLRYNVIYAGTNASGTLSASIFEAEHRKSTVAATSNSLRNRSQSFFRQKASGRTIQNGYSNIYPTKCNVTQFIISGNCSTCLEWYHHPSSGAQTTVSTASGICHTVTATCRYSGTTRNM